MKSFFAFLVVVSLVATPLASFAQVSPANLSEIASLLESIQQIINQISSALSVPTASAACSTTSFQASTDFSSTQRYCGWSYLYGNTPMTWVPNNPDAGFNTWKGNEQYSLLWSYGGLPGQNSDSVRRWTSPIAGTATISGTVSDTNTGGGDGVVVSIKKGGTVLWGPVSINGLAGSGLSGSISFNISTSVSAGTVIDFVINKGAINNWWDNTSFDPRITIATSMPTPSAYLNSPGVTSVTVTQGNSFTLVASKLYPSHDVYYDQLSGPNGAVYDLGPIGTADANGNFSKAFSTASWPVGTYTLVVYSKNAGIKTSNNSNSLIINVTAPSTNSPPTVGTVTPINSSSAVGTEVKFTTVYSDPNGWQNLAWSLFLINTIINGANAAYGYYNQDTNRFYLMNDTGTAWLGGCVPGSGTVIENSYAKLSCVGSTAVGSGNNLTVTFAMTFKNTFAGTKNVYMYARDDSGLTRTWIKKGTWNVASSYDEIRVDYRYLRDYFTPQVTSLQFHKEITSSTLCNISCNLGLITPENKLIRPVIDDRTNKLLVFRVPKTTTKYHLSLIDDYRATTAGLGNVYYKLCPTNKNLRCNRKLNMGNSGNMYWLTFNHVVGVDETIEAFGFNFDAPMRYLTGKHSVKFFGDGLPYGSDITPIPFLSILSAPWTAGINWFLTAYFSPSNHPSANHFDNLKYHFPVNSMLAKECQMTFFTNATPGSILAKKTEAAARALETALGGIFKYNFIHGSGKTVSDMPIVFSGTGCTKDSRCGEDGTNDIIFVSDPNLKLYSSLASEMGISGIGGVTNFFGVTGSLGNNEIAWVVTNMKIGLNTAGLDFANDIIDNGFREVMIHELSHTVVSKGAMDAIIFDSLGYPTIPSGVLQTIQSVYSKKCKPVL